VGLLVLSPVLMLLIMIIRVATGQSPFFLQQRLGKDAVPFQIIKFKTMSDA
jgi:lipopolysaccharide/colanic/teichoic acid biosynthesis glycosyltransferase